MTVLKGMQYPVCWVLLFRTLVPIETRGFKCFGLMLWNAYGIKGRPHLKTNSSCSCALIPELISAFCGARTSGQQIRPLCSMACDVWCHRSSGDTDMSQEDSSSAALRSGATDRSQRQHGPDSAQTPGPTGQSCALGYALSLTGYRCLTPSVKQTYCFPPKNIVIGTFWCLWVQVESAEHAYELNEARHCVLVNVSFSVWVIINLKWKKHLFPTCF